MRDQHNENLTNKFLEKYAVWKKICCMEENLTNNLTSYNGSTNIG
jgi:hypothetical protein